MKIVFPMVSLLPFVGPSARADFTYSGSAASYLEYPDNMSAVAQPDEEAPYPVRTAYCAPWRVEPATLLRELTEGLEGLTAL
jgi:hypothetical protein